MNLIQTISPLSFIHSRPRRYFRLVAQLKTLTQLCFQPACHPLNPNAPPEELWELECASYYNGELILQRPIGVDFGTTVRTFGYPPTVYWPVPPCEMTYPKYETLPIHWDCLECGWMDDSV